MTFRQFKQVDVFREKLYTGNPVAVFFDSDDLTTEQMQQMARWTNLSETTFLLKPTNPLADYRLRIFCPQSELPFAGHPTLGSCFAALEAGICSAKEGKIVQECEVGLVELAAHEKEGKRFISFECPPCSVHSVTSEAIEKLEDGLNLPSGFTKTYSPPTLIVPGPRWLVVELENARQVLELKPDMQKVAEASERFGWTGVQVFGQREKGIYEMRNFAPNIGVPEDPACGSGSAALGVFLKLYKGMSEGFEIMQGSAISRDAHLSVSIKGEKIHVGGYAVTCVDGKAIV